MLRLLFEKTGDGVYLSHLDLMRVFQRAFQRAGVMLKHSQGFSPRPYVSVALPLSVGVESVCELLDYELEQGSTSPEDLAERLNRTMPVGVRVLEAYDGERKIKELCYLRATLTLEYDRGVPAGAAAAMTALFDRETLTVEKHSKKGMVETDIRPMVRHVSVEQPGEQELRITATVCAQNPALNPMLLYAAVERYLPEYAADFCRCRREAVLDAAEKPFR